jgi:hypothetical protein
VKLLYAGGQTGFSAREVDFVEKPALANALYAQTQSQQRKLVVTHDY